MSPFIRRLLELIRKASDELAQFKNANGTMTKTPSSMAKYQELQSLKQQLKKAELEEAPGRNRDPGFPPPNKEFGTGAEYMDDLRNRLAKSRQQGGVTQPDLSPTTPAQQVPRATRQQAPRPIVDPRQRQMFNQQQAPEPYVRQSDSERLSDVIHQLDRTEDFMQMSFDKNRLAAFAQKQGVSPEAMREAIHKYYDPDQELMPYGP